MRGQAVLARLAFLPVSLVLALALLEFVLQVGALYVDATRSDPPAWLTGDRRILCLGDSHTYGLWLDRDQAYPEQLEALWNESVESPKIEVINLGLPGMHSSRLRREFPGLLETFAPDLVILIVG